MERREFLKMGIVAGAAVAVSAMPAMAEASYTEFTINECMKLTPQQMAENSGAVMESWKYIQRQAVSIKNPKLRKEVQEIIANPAPKLMSAVSGRKKDVLSGT